MITGPLKADGRLAAKNATKIRAALAQVTNFKSVFDRYKETQPQATDNKAQDRSRARAWLMLNVGFNNEALHNAIMHAWAEAYVLGQEAAGEWIKKAEKAQKSLQDGMVDWDNWTPGDKATALLVKPIGGFQRYLEQSGGASYFKKFDKETVEMLGTALANSIEAGLGSEAAALLMKDHVASAGRALTIAITEQNRAMSFSTIQRYKEAELQKMEWHVSDPCPKCAQNSGQVIEIGGTFNSGNQQPPAHPHCRCVLLPVIPGMEEDPIPGASTTTLPTGMAHTGSTPQAAPVMAVPNPGAGGSFAPGNWREITSDEFAARQKERYARLFENLPHLADDMLKRDPATKEIINNGTVFVNGQVEVRFYARGADTPKANMEEIINHLEKLQMTNPKSGEVVLTIGTEKAGAYGWAVVDGTDIWIAPKTAKMDQPNTNEGGKFKMPALSTNKQYLYTLTHEWGHHIDTYDKTRSTRIGVIKRKYSKEFRSEYARTSRYEFYAEMFAEYFLTGGKTENALVQAMAKEFGWQV